MKIFLDDIKQQCETCTNCPLYKTKTHTVFSDGNINAKIFFIGEAPGENEDLQGKPFVGMAGKIMNKYLELAGISREDDLYITNIVKCRPPQNRKPKVSEKKACFNFLCRQIELINPKVIVLCGGTALETFIKGKKISDVHGQNIKIEINEKTYNAVPIYHPSPLCRVPDKQKITVDDLKKIFQLAQT
ncbi:uracil-DNA glycosylase [bacterium]|nr:uracil-DNA glycosylase [bacterium]